MEPKASSERGRDRKKPEQRPSAGRGQPGRSRKGKLAPELERYYRAEAVPCPLGCGGKAEVVRHGTLAGGGGELWLECTSCAQRARYEVPPPSAAEKVRALEGTGEGRPGACVRHAMPVPLERLGRRLVCAECGIVYRES
jgi:hypothetical protein